MSNPLTRRKRDSKLSSPSPVPNLSPKSRSQIQVQNPKSKVQRKGTGTGADTIILWPSMTFHNLLWPFITCYHLLRPLWPSMIKCLLSRPGLIAGPLLSTPLPNNSQSIPRLDHIDSKSSFKHEILQRLNEKNCFSMCHIDTKLLITV